MRAPPRGFTLLELLISLALFAIVGIAMITLLGQGMGVFTSGTEDRGIQDRFGAFWPTVRDDLAAIHVVDGVGVPPPPAAVETGPGAALTGPPPAPPPAPDLRLRSGVVKLVDGSAERPAYAFVAAWVRTNAREAEDPVLGAASAAAAGTELKRYVPETVDSGVTGNLLPTGGLLEVAYVALHVPAATAGQHAPPSVLTVFRCFRAPIGGKGSLLDLDSLDSLAKIRAAGRPIAEGVLHFSITWRNVFATSWEPTSTARIEDGQPYVGWTWDSTRGDERMKDFPLHAGKASLSDPADDVFPAHARVELALATPTPWGWRAETSLSQQASADAVKIVVDDPEPLVGPGPPERWLKVGDEWMLAQASSVDLATREVTVVRGRRSTKAAEHPAATPVHLGAHASTDVELTPKDRYVRRR